MQARQSAQTWDRLRVFSLLWGLAMIIHTSAFAFNIVSTPVSIVMILIAALLVLYSHSIPLLLALSSVQLIEFFIRAPIAPNHWYLATFMNLTIVTVISYRLLRHKRLHRDDLYDTIAVSGRMVVLLLFVMAAFHKINHDYLDTGISCGVWIYGRVADMYHFPQGGIITVIVIYATFLVETLIPLLLLIPRTRNWGILGGLLFHMFLGMREVYDFGAILYALYFLFTARQFLPVLATRHSALLKFTQGKRWLAVIAVILLLLIPTRWFYGVQWPAEVFAPLWVIASLFVIYLFVTTIFSETETQPEPISALFRPMSAIAVFVGVVCLANSLSPYLGLKSNAAFEMYSNLQAENGKSNHLLIPASWQIFGFTRDTVEIITTDDPEFQSYIDNNQFITRHELIRRSTRTPYFTTTVRYQDAIYTLPSDLNAMGRVNPILLKLLTFDPIEQAEQIACTW